MPKLPKTLKMLISGGPGTGKTTLSLTFPKVGYIGTEPNGLDVLRINHDLQKNLVDYQEFLPTVTEDIKQTFDRLEAYIKQLHAWAKEGKVETLVLDNLTFLSLNRWIYIDRYERIVSGSGNLDTRGMYGNLGNWLYRFCLLSLTSFPGNVCITAHEQRDDEEDMAKSLNPGAPITADVLGRMRYRVTGLVSASLFLTRKKVGPNKWQFLARCVEGEGKAAKNRLGLPEIVEDVSYAKIISTLNGYVGQMGSAVPNAQ